MARHYRPGATKLSSEQAEAIRVRYESGGASQDALGREFGVSQVAVSKIVRGVTYQPLAAKPSECPLGHALSAENSYINPRGVTECRACRRAARNAYCEGNPSRVRLQLKAAKRRRKARLRGVAATLTAEEWERLQDDHERRCHYCGAGGGLDQEHLTPLSRGGAHEEGNVAPACRVCNSQKGTLTEREFAQATWACLPGLGTVCLNGALLGRIEVHRARSHVRPSAVS